MYKLPDSPEKRALVEYLKQQIENYEQMEYAYGEKTRRGDECYAKEMAYRDILNKIE